MKGDKILDIEWKYWVLAIREVICCEDNEVDQYCEDMHNESQNLPLIEAFEDWDIHKIGGFVCDLAHSFQGFEQDIRESISNDRSNSALMEIVTELAHEELVHYWIDEVGEESTMYNGENYIEEAQDRFNDYYDKYETIIKNL